MLRQPFAGHALGYTDAEAFRFRHQPSRLIPARAVANKGKAAGRGMGAEMSEDNTQEPDDYVVCKIGASCRGLTNGKWNSSRRCRPTQLRRAAYDGQEDWQGGKKTCRLVRVV